MAENVVISPPQFISSIPVKRAHTYTFTAAIGIARALYSASILFLLFQTFHDETFRHLISLSLIKTSSKRKFRAILLNNLSMSKKLSPQYNPHEVESKIYEKWEKSGYFNPDNLPGERREKFSMVLPPPNVTGTLHMGHALTVTIEDILARFERMRGKKTLWLPGTDHAAIATETKFLKEKKVSKNEFADRRDEFVKQVNEYAAQNQKIIIAQLRAMGASLDWSRLAFTLDDARQKAVYAAFKRMYDAGLIYHGEYLVNWDVKGQTTVSDEEIEYETAKGILYTFKYSKTFPIPVATTRPETKLGDVAVAVHPEGRWKKYIGQEFEVENFAGVTLRLKIVGDETVNPEFGTGAVGITPAHSKLDWEIARRHGLPTKYQIINEYGKIINTKTDWDGKIGIKEAREKIIEWLKKENLLEKEEVIEHNIAKAQRSGGMIEILPKRHQFFVNVNKPIRDRGGKTLKELMRETVINKKIEIIPERFEKVYLHWIDTLRDWNISRQIWYGHKILAWYKNDDVVVGETAPGDGWQEIPDTFDTWFSSGLWTFSTLGWPEKTEDLETYHPTDLLETGYDILFFWVARMILMSCFLLNEIPFRKVYLHGLVRDNRRRKMSKSLGNVIDPLDMTKKYGTDALRMALVFNNAPGTDFAISEEKIKGMRNFSNKLWNITRFVLENTEYADLNAEYAPQDKLILDKFQVIVKDITKHITEYRLDRAADSLYHYIWHEFADKIIEQSKAIFRGEDAEENGPGHIASRKKLLLSILSTSIKTLHPFMPFITEHIWELLPLKNKKMLIIEEWPVKVISDK